MPKRNREEYGSNHRGTDTSEHAPDTTSQHEKKEATEHKADFKTEHKTADSLQENGDGKTVDFQTKFNKELRGIDDRAAAVFDPKGNIADYSAEDRKSFTNAYVTAFNKVAPKSRTSPTLATQPEERLGPLPLVDTR